VQKHLRLNWRQTRLPPGRRNHRHLIRPGVGVAQRTAVAPVDKHQPPAVDRQRQRVALCRRDRAFGRCRGEFMLKQPLQRRIFPVLLLAVGNPQLHDLLPVLPRLIGARCRGVEQALPLLQRLLRFTVGR